MSNFKNIDETTAAQKQAHVSITINESLAMSFGKMAIAAAHAAQNLFLQMEKADSRFNDLWEKTNYQTIVHVDQLSELNDLTVAVEDLGLSEVASGSITAQATARVY